MMTLITWSTAALSVFGTFLVIRKRRAGFYLWCFTNVVWVIVDIKANLYAQATLFVVYLGMSVYGAWEWRQEHKKINGGAYGLK